MNVRQLIADLQNLDPDLPVVVASGDGYDLSAPVFDRVWAVMCEDGEGMSARENENGAVQVIRL